MAGTEVKQIIEHMDRLHVENMKQHQQLKEEVQKVKEELSQRIDKLTLVQDKGPSDC
jgi:hypothetical protein